MSAGIRWGLINMMDKNKPSLRTRGFPVFSAGQGGTSTAVVVSGFVYSKWQFTCCGSETFSGTEALNATTGKPVFDAGFSPTSAPAVAGGTLFVASAGAFDAFDALVAQRVPRRDLLWPSSTWKLWDSRSSATHSGRVLQGGT